MAGFRWLQRGYRGSHFDSRNFGNKQGATLTLEIFSDKHSFVLAFSEQIQFMLMVNIVNLNQIIKIKELYCTTKQEEGKLRTKFTRWPPSWIWVFQVSWPPQLLRMSLTVVYTCQDHVLESLKMAFFIVVLDSKYSKMTPKFVKQKSQWLHSSIKFANAGEKTC